MENSLHESITTALSWRYATKKFDAQKKIPDADWKVLEEALRLAPSSFGLQPWKFVVVKSADVKKKLAPVSWGQPQIESCSHLVVIAPLKKVDEAYVAKFITQVAQVRDAPREALKGYEDMIVGSVVKGGSFAAIQQHWTARQAYIAAGTFMTAAALLHIDVCPMEGIDGSKYDEILGLKNTDYGVVAVLAAGYRAADDATQKDKKVRFPRADVIQVI